MSTLSTTPHLLHTRPFLVLPYDTKVTTNQSHLASVSVPNKTDPAATRERARQRTLERAAKRFQIVTKEADWRIANAYVSLAASDASASSSTGSETVRGTPVLDKEEKEWRSGQRHGDDAAGLQEKHQPGGVAPLTTGVVVAPSRSSVLLSEETGGSSISRERCMEATALAVDAYLDDDDWEAQERARGRGPSSMLGRASTSRRAGGRGFSSWLGGAWAPEKALYNKIDL